MDSGPSLAHCSTFATRGTSFSRLLVGALRVPSTQPCRAPRILMPCVRYINAMHTNRLLPCIPHYTASQPGLFKRARMHSSCWDLQACMWASNRRALLGGWKGGRTRQTQCRRGQSVAGGRALLCCPACWAPSLQAGRSSTPGCGPRHRSCPTETPGQHTSTLIT